MMQEAIKNSGGDNVVAKDLTPLVEGFVGGDDDRSPFVSFGDELKKEFSGLLREREIAEFIDNEQINATELIKD